MFQFLIAHGVTPQFLFGVAAGMAIGCGVRLFEYWIT